MNKEKSLTKNSFFYLIYNVLNVVFPLFTGIYVARVLLPLNIGQVESARNLAQYFVILSFLGIPTYGLMEIAKARNNKNKLDSTYSELMIINGISTVLFSVVYFLIVLSVSAYREKLLLYTITGLSIALNLFNNSWLFEGLEEFKYISVKNLFFKIASFALLLLLVRSQDDYLWYAAITIIGAIGNSILNLAKSRKIVHFSFKNINLSQHIKPILFLVVVNLAIEIYSLVDVTMLGLLCNDETVAYYSYGMRIHRILIQLINTFTIVIVPRLAFYYKESDKEKFNALISKTLQIIFVLTIPAIIGIWFTSDYLLPAIYGEQYIRSSYVLKTLSFILLISPIGYLLGSRTLLVSGREKQMVIPVAIGAVSNVCFNILLIPIYKEIGAALASVIGEIAVTIVYIVLGKREFKLKGIVVCVAKIFVASLSMFLFLFFISLTQVTPVLKISLEILGSITIYFSLLLLFKEQTCVSLLGKIVRKRKAEKE